MDLLISSKNKSNPPILIEIWVTHKSSESKLNSKYRIIEIHIESEDDIKQIINNASIVETDDMTILKELLLKFLMTHIN